MIFHGIKTCYQAKKLFLPPYPPCLTKACARFRIRAESLCIDTIRDHYHFLFRETLSNGICETCMRICDDEISKARKPAFYLIYTMHQPVTATQFRLRTTDPPHDANVRKDHFEKDSKTHF